MLEKKLDIKLANENSLIDRVKAAAVKYVGKTVLAAGIAFGSVGCESENGDVESECCIELYCETASSSGRCKPASEYEASHCIVKHGSIDYLSCCSCYYTPNIE